MDPLIAPARAGARAALPPGWWAPALTGSEQASRPAWAGVTEQAIAAAAAPEVLPPADSWAEAFAVPLRPFLDGTEARLAEGARRLLGPGEGDPGRIASAFTARLACRLTRLAVRTLAAELAAARAAGRLSGADGRGRFADFLRWQSTPAGLAALFGNYPVLARLAGTASLQATEAGLELLARFAADRAAVVSALLGGRDPGAVVAVEPGLGDPHQEGRSVAAVTFADGRTVIYKPRGQDAYVLYQEAVSWLNQRLAAAGLRTAAVLARRGYGWQEFVAHQPLDRPEDADRFYHREGLLLALLYALNATDIHAENLIAVGDQPVLVDTEALLHPVLPVPHTVAPDPAAQALATSVHGTALLPFVVAGELGVLDMSGIAGDAGAACPDGVLDWDQPGSDELRLIRRPAAMAALANRPWSGGQAVEPAEHEAALRAGFRLGYDAIVAGRAEFARLLEARGGIETRVIVRRSSGYARLADESTDPSLLRDARDRQQALAVLAEVSAGQPMWNQVTGHELADLWAGDIPLLTGRPASRDLWTSAGQRLAGLLPRPGLASALAKIAEMGEVDRRDQEWIISASLATRCAGDDHRSTRAAPAPVTTVASPDRLLAAACGLADQIVARALSGPARPGENQVNWLGLQAVEDTRWMLLPMGAGLADGYLGVALFLAQLAALTGIGRYAETARRSLRGLPPLLEVLASRPDLLAVIGCGASSGLGGISYGLARLAVLLPDAGLGELAAAAVQLTAAAAELPGPPGWSSGLAGCLAAMTATGAELDCPAADRLAGQCADRLAELVERTDGRCAPGGPVPPGFAHGPAGVSWALAGATAGARPAWGQAARHAMRHGGPPARQLAAEGSYGWCRGAAGLLAARSRPVTPAAAAEIPAAVRLLTRRPVLANLSLCHGELGIAESLIVLAGPARNDWAAREWRRRAGVILDAVHRCSATCGTPGGVSTPGLLDGLAGIGYGLLRLGYPRQVPSVLFLEPASPRVHPPEPADPDRRSRQA